MKLLQLSIENLASIQQATIDFEHGPLAGATVFLISGTTGAGKSTVLDAICLALYNQVPRMNKIRTKRLNDEDKTDKEAVGVDSPLQLLRRGTGYTRVCLNFIGRDGNEYQAVWQVQRARKKPGAKLQKPELPMFLITRDADGNETTRTPIKRDQRNAGRVGEEVLGLTYTQFCRTTMLAQGDFANFLRSDGEEKSDILAKITARTDFAAIGRAIHTIYTGHLNAANDVKTRIEALQLPDAQTVENLAADTARNTAALERARIRLARVNQVHTSQTQIVAAERTLAEARLRLEALAKDFGLTVRQADARARQADADFKAIGDARAKIAALGGRQTLLQHARQVENLLNVIRLQRKDVASATQQAQSLKPLLDEQKAAIAAKTEELNRVNAVHERQQNEIDALKNRAQTLDVAGTISRNNSLSRRLNALKILQQDLDKITGDRNVARDAADARKNTVAQIASTRVSAQNHKTAYQSLEDALTLAKAALTDQAGALRAKLTPGCRCPVCMQTVADVNKTDLCRDNEALAELQRKTLVAKTTFDEHNNRLHRLSGLLEASDKQLADLQKVIDKAVQEAEAKAGELKIICDSAAIDAEIKRVLEQIAFISKTVHEANDLNMKIKAAENQQKKLDAGRIKAQNNLTAAVAQATRTDARIKALEEQAHRSQAVVDQTLSQLKSLPGAADWQIEGGGLRLFADDFSALEKQVNALDRDIARLTVSADAASTVADTVKAQCQTIAQHFANPTEEGDTDVPAIGDRQLSAQATALVADTVAAANMAANASQTIAKLGPEVKLFTDQCADQDAQGQNIAVQQTTDLIAKHLREANEAVEGLNAEKGRLDALARAYRSAAERFATLTAEYEAKRSEADRWLSLDRELGDEKGSKFNRIAQSYVLADLLRRANAYLGVFGDRYTLHCPPGTYRIDVADNAAGGALRAASSLSGGESFMVSLAMALALGEMGNGLSIDPLFIDEGFGTLSGRYLDQAVQLLGTLRRTLGRRVGIISHVEALRRAIAVQINLTPDPRTGATALTVTDQSC